MLIFWKRYIITSNLGLGLEEIDLESNFLKSENFGLTYFKGSKKVKKIIS